MVRLMLTLTPVVCVLSGIAFSYTYEKYLVDDGEQPKRFDLYLPREHVSTSQAQRFVGCLDEHSALKFPEPPRLKNPKFMLKDKSWLILW